MNHNLFHNYFQWNHGKLIAMGWSDSEDLICVLENAKVFVFDMFGTEKESYSIGGEAQIMEAKVFQTSTGTAIAVKTTSGRIYLKQNSKKPERRLPDIPSKHTHAIMTHNVYNHSLPQIRVRIIHAGRLLLKVARATVC